MGRLHRLPHYDYGQPGYYFLTFCTKDRACTLAHFEPGATAYGVGHSPPVGRDDPGAPCGGLSLTATGQILDRYIHSISRAYPYVTLHKYVIMPNHVHLLISIDTPEQGAPGLSRPTEERSRPTELVPRMITVLKRFTNRFSGKDLWQDGYHDHVIRHGRDYLRIWSYIDANPAKWTEDCYFKETCLV